MDLTILAGRNVRAGQVEPSEVLLNRTAVKQLGFERVEDVIGHEPHRNLRVVGVVEDFVFQSLHESVKPLVLSMSWLPHWFGLAVALESPDADRTAAAGMRRVAGVLEQFAPAPFFRITPYGERMRESYEAERRLERAVAWVSGAALLLVIAGLWSMSAFAASEREREYGIRKVLGARMSHVVALHLSEFLRVLPIALVLGTVPGYIAMERWLERFAWRSDALVGPLIGVGLVLALVTGAAALLSAIRLLSRRPVESLASD